MAYQQVREIFSRVRKFHRQFRNALLGTETREHSQEVEALLNRGREEERLIEACLSRYSDEAEPNILDTWIQYVPDEDVIRTIRETEVRPGMTLTEIIEKKIEFDDALVSLYARLAEQVNGERLQDAFRSLHDLMVRRREQDAWKLIDSHRD
ncbi:MAG: hypothetical protein ACF8PG_14725 [Maioricimonas sp. JB045]